MRWSAHEMKEALRRTSTWIGSLYPRHYFIANCCTGGLVIAAFALWEYAGVRHEAIAWMVVAGGFGFAGAKFYWIGHFVWYAITRLRGHRRAEIGK